jgi:ABC-type phosphate transport system substrate-binding protein
MSFVKTISLLVFGVALGAQAQVPAGYPADYKSIVDGAKKEGKVVVYSTTDAKLASPLLKDFEAAFPGIKVEYTDLNSTEVYNRFISESAANATSADAVWSSSMDLQMKLAADGLAMSYKSPEAAALPAWARWKDSVYATTFEPIVIVYNKRLVPPGRSQDPRRLRQAAEHQSRQVSEEGHHLRCRKIRCRLHARESGREVESAVLGPGQGHGRARGTCRARPAP